MKKLLLLFYFITFSIYSQQAYYNGVNLTLTGIPLKNELATKTISSHTKFLSYADIWESSKVTDLDPTDITNSKVILIYGYSDIDGNYVTDRTRDKTLNGGTAGTQWNREHTYAQSLGTPALGTAGPGSDGHHLRPADITFNGQRSSLKFDSGSGFAGPSGSGWYPGDEWKGDIARMMMYMYLRYGSQCLPSNVCFGTTNTVDSGMINLLLDWNAQDPVSQLEDNRNTYHGNSSNTFAQGNRNPFIDNPNLATQIWGGTPAEDRWNTVPDTQAPTAPTNLIASNITNTTVNLNWTASTDDVGVTSYEIFKDGVFLASSATNSFSVTGLIQNTTYNFTVYAKDAAGNTSTVSNTANITTTNIIDTQAPSAIIDLIASGTTDITTNLNWTASTDNIGVIGYDVYKDAVFLATTVSNSYAVTGLTASTSYNFTVFAKDGAGNISLVSNTAAVTTNATPVGGTSCGTETFANIPTITSSSYLARTWTGDNGGTWNATDARTDQTLTGKAIIIRNGSLTSNTVSGGISEITVTTQRVFTGGSGTFNVRVNGTLVGAIPYDATVQTTTLTGFNISGNIIISLTDKASTTDRVAVDNLTWNCSTTTLDVQELIPNLFNVYPNPATKNHVTISVANNQQIDAVQFYNLMGQLIINIKNPKIIQQRISIDHIPKGMYIIKVFNEKAYSTKRLIVN